MLWNLHMVPTCSSFKFTRDTPVQVPTFFLSKTVSSQDKISRDFKIVEGKPKISIKALLEKLSLK